MYCYYYTPAEVGLSEFPAGYFKLAGFDVVTDPSIADVFILPADIRWFTNKELLALPYREGNEQRHVFFTLSEFTNRVLPFNALAFRTDANTGLLAAGNTNTKAQSWGVDDLAAYMKLPDNGFQFDIHAQLWASSPLTDVTVESCNRAGLVVHDQRHNFFYGTLETNQDERLGELRRTFLDTMQRSRLVLVPRSRSGVNRYRFYEAMSMGRVPVLLCDDCLLPCADRINYERCSIRIAEGDAGKVGEILREWLRTHTAHELIQMGLYGREMWKRYLASAVWEQTWGMLTREHLEALRV